MTSTLPMVLPAALLLDLVLGDPPWLPHPVRWMGRVISAGEPRFRRLPFGVTLNGALLAGTAVLGTWFLAGIALRAAGVCHPWLKTGLEVVLIYYCVSIKSLAQAAEAVVTDFILRGLPGARQAVAQIVGRDVQSLDAEGIFRATVETVAENLVDGVAAPLFFAAIGGAPLCMAYKMINTLDSMIGYKNDTYLAFGKAAARLDDAANFIPARLIIPFIAAAAQMLGGTGCRSFRTSCRDGRRHSSPNAGYPEAAFSGALGVTLGGPNTYGGRLVKKPFIGASFGSAAMPDIRKACDLMMLSALLWFAALYAVMILGKAVT